MDDDHPTGLDLVQVLPVSLRDRETLEHLGQSGTDHSSIHRRTGEGGDGGEGINLHSFARMRVIWVVVDR